ncbi:MAG TPA: DUF4870 domain-containing protein [Colwellia sp.]|nr:DUF4870 domain-containing protein [Colwellia sp.]
MSNKLVEDTKESSKDSKNMSLLMWIGTIFFSFIPGLVLFLIKKEDAYIQKQSKEALNWSITAMIGYVIGFVLTFIAIGALVFPVVGICHFIFCIMGAIATSKGKEYKVPFAIRLIK